MFDLAHHIGAGFRRMQDWQGRFQAPAGGLAPCVCNECIVHACGFMGPAARGVLRGQALSAC
jgi:hypothetical protein